MGPHTHTTDRSISFFTPESFFQGLGKVTLISRYIYLFCPQPVLWIWIRMFLSIPDPHPSLFCKDPDKDPSINKQKK
jgi:hypothetical protein